MNLIDADILKEKINDLYQNKDVFISLKCIKNIIEEQPTIIELSIPIQIIEKINKKYDSKEADK